MFPSAGYFRSANCPFFIHGLCHRPYCHFRHAKPGHGSGSKAAIKSSLKTAKSTNAKTDNTDTVSTSQTSDTQTKETLTCTSSQYVINSNVKSHNDTKSKVTPENIDNIIHKHSNDKDNKQTDKTPQTKASSILESLNKLEKAVEEASASLQKSKKNSESLTSHKSYTRTGVKVDQKTQGSTGVDLNSNASGKALKSTNYNSQEISSNSEEITLSLVSQPCEEDTKVKETLSLKDSSIISAMDTEIASSTEILPLEVKIDIAREQVELKTTKLPKEVSDPQTKVTKAKRVLDVDGTESSVLKKKRKNSGSSDNQSIKTKIRDKDLGNSASSHTNKDLTTQKKSSITKKATFVTEEEIEIDSPAKLEGSKSSRKRKNSTETSKNKDKVIDNKVKNLEAEKALKKKRELADINFFSSSHKKPKHKTQQKERNTEKIDSPSTSKIEKREKDDVKLKTMRKHMIARSSKNKNEAQKDGSISEKNSKIQGDSKKKASNSVMSINSLFESDEEAEQSSNSLSDSEQDTMDSATETLKEIFDNYKPQKDKTKHLSMDASAAGSSGIAAVDSSPAKEKSASDVQGLTKKKRVAHNPTYLVPRKTSNINPIRRGYPKNVASTPAQQPQPSSSGPTNAIQSKKRVAHAPKPTTKTSVPRPRIPIEYGAKVPQNLRQRYLDKIIDENLRLCATEKEAFEKAVEEERHLYERSTRRTMYMNLCVNAITKLRTEPTPEFQPQPTSPPVSTASTATTTGETSNTSTKSPKKIDEANLTEENTYDLLSQYILDEDQLVENGYPRHCPSTPGKVTFKSRRPVTTPSKDPNRRTCCRCGRHYSVHEDGTYVRQEECVYHVGRLFRRRTAGEISSSYQCCGGDASTLGCAVCKFHVSEGKNATDGFMTTIISPLAGRQKKVFGVDCEMCYTMAGLELTRVTVVDWKLDKIYDTFVKPDNPVLDYNTRFSGVTHECLRGVKTSIREVQAVLLSMISKYSIIVGHSLESDLLSLKLVHSTIVDTSVVFPHRLGPPYKRALRTLMAEFLKKIIQNSEGGHDSYEDAAASLELMLFKVKEDLKKKERHKTVATNL